MIRRHRLSAASLALLLVSTMLGGPAQAQQSAEAAAPNAATDPLLTDFRDPPQSSRPRVWWHWMNGNITQDGITRDIDWMARVGLGGFPPCGGGGQPA